MSSRPHPLQSVRFYSHLAFKAIKQTRIKKIRTQSSFSRQWSGQVSIFDGVPRVWITLKFRVWVWKVSFRNSCNGPKWAQWRTDFKARDQVWDQINQGINSRSKRVLVLQGPRSFERFTGFQSWKRFKGDQRSFRLKCVHPPSSLSSVKSICLELKNANVYPRSSLAFNGPSHGHRYGVR